MHRLARFLILGIFAVTWLGCAAEPEPLSTVDSPLYVDNHVPLGHGPLPVVGSMPTWGEIEISDGGSNGERWLGNVAGAYAAHPTAGKHWIWKSPAPNTYAVACELAGCTGGRTWVVTSSWHDLGFVPAVVNIQYDDACPITPGENTVHVRTGDWTPMDSGGLLTYVIANGIVKPGLPYGDYLHAGDRDGPGSWCTFNFSDYPAVPKPAGAPNHGVAVDACP